MVNQFSRVQTDLNEEMDKQVYQYKLQTEESNRLFDEFIKLQNQNIFKSLQRARSRYTHGLCTCGVCYDDIQIVFI